MQSTVARKSLQVLTEFSVPIIFMGFIELNGLKSIATSKQMRVIELNNSKNHNLIQHLNFVK